MNFRALLPVLPLLFVTLPAFAGDDKAKARLKDLQIRVIKQEFADDKLRRELLTFCREQVGTPLYSGGEAEKGSGVIVFTMFVQLPTGLTKQIQ